MAKPLEGVGPQDHSLGKNHLRHRKSEGFGIPSERIGSRAVATVFQL
jgi:hypothetical protein